MKKLQKWWIAIVIIIPFILLLGLHIAIALGRYFKIDFNPPGIDAGAWFAFAGSYLGGVMTVAGVMLTLKYNRKENQHRSLLENIDREKEQLGRVVCEINTSAPGAVYQQMNSLQVTQDGYNASEIATVRYRLIEEIDKINKLKLEVIYFTDIYAMTAGCAFCKKPCRIQTVLPEFQKIYETVGKQIYEALQEVNQYVDELYINALCRAQIARYQMINENCRNMGQPPQYSDVVIQEYRNKIVDVKPRQDKIYTMLTEISNYNQKEILQLGNLAKEYIFLRRQNADKQCFSD